MRRRGNKSTKVPNVKLRPAQPAASSSRSVRNHGSLDSDGVWEQDSQLASDDTSMFDTCPRPFTGVVLCATGVSDKPGLFRQAVELGATTCSAFTDRVTHLIAIQHGGAKYMCALERKIPILQPSWITESYQIWLRGDDVVFSESLQKHRLPIFSSVVICPSGIADIRRRTEINKLVTANGGTYLKNLERPVRVTHLLCSGEEETDKMRYAEKFNQRGEADIKLVWEEWFWDSLDFGGRFDEDKYQVRRPRPEPRKSIRGAEPPTSPPPSSALLSNASQLQPQNQLAAKTSEKGKGKDVTTDNNGEVEEQATVKRLPAVQLHIWASLLKPRGYTVDEEGTGLVRSPTKPRPVVSGEDEEEGGRSERGRGEGEGETQAKARSSGSILSRSSFRRANSFAQGVKERRVLSSKTKGLDSALVLENEDEGESERASVGETAEEVVVDQTVETGFGMEMEIDTPGAGPSTPRRLPLDSNRSFAKGGQGDAASAVVDVVNDPGAAASTTATTTTKPLAQYQSQNQKQIFSGMTFVALGEANRPNVREAIRRAGGVLDDGVSVGLDGTPSLALEKQGDINIVIVRLASGSKLFSSLPPTNEPWRAKFRTECWLERCLYEERICEAEEHVSFVPVGVKCPVQGAEKVSIGFSGFDEPERLSLTRLVKVLGLNFHPGFSKRATHLLCPSAEGSKYDKAREWGTPVVGMGWLEEMKRCGRVPDVERFLVEGRDGPIVVGAGGVGAQGNAESGNNVDVKGKGKAGDNLRITDITNGQSQSQTQEESQDHFTHAGAGVETRLPLPLPPLRPQPQPISAVPSLSKLTLSSQGSKSGSGSGSESESRSGSGTSNSFGKPTNLLLSKVQPKAKAISKDTSAAVSVPPPPILPPIPPVAIETETGGESSPGMGQMGQSLSQVERIPSSTSPSPLKLPVLNSNSGTATDSDGRVKAIVRAQGKGKEKAMDETEMTLPDLASASASATGVNAGLNTSAGAGAGVGASAAAKLNTASVNGKNKSRALTRVKSISPSKYYPPVAPLDSEKTRDLKESLSSLLGKRKSEEGEGGGEGEGADGGKGDGGMGAGTSTSGGGGRGRYGGRSRRDKRSRLGRSEIQQTDHERDAEHDYDPLRFPAYDQNDDTFDAGFGGRFGGAQDELGDELGLLGEQRNQEEESMRVTYEDPGERAEKRRLMRLFAGDGEPEENEVEIVSVGTSVEKGIRKRGSRAKGR